MHSSPPDVSVQVTPSFSVLQCGGRSANAKIPHLRSKFAVRSLSDTAHKTPPSCESTCTRRGQNYGNRAQHRQPHNTHTTPTQQHTAARPSCRPMRSVVTMRATNRWWRVQSRGGWQHTQLLANSFVFLLWITSSRKRRQFPVTVHSIARSTMCFSMCVL